MFLTILATVKFFNDTDTAGLGIVCGVGRHHLTSSKKPNRTGKTMENLCGLWTKEKKKQRRNPKGAPQSATVFSADSLRKSTMIWEQTGPQVKLGNHFTIRNVSEAHPGFARSFNGCCFQLWIWGMPGKTTCFWRNPKIHCCSNKPHTMEWNRNQVKKNTIGIPVIPFIYRFLSLYK